MVGVVEEWPELTEAKRNETQELRQKRQHDHRHLWQESMSHTILVSVTVYQHEP